ncbi:uncharacterized protein LAESUDRAFT_759881 [Laetiporus sulphureus 93-53]|uniref:UBC core domain-containing protein n=1 Tax=Laetiporus sulphureus 93-53 TaxID=1314785 RepID=A0A165E098_9APHY|nr:uncharacterized protein LAESUDRAFT_759881 [Laetiporus sulphureus 93-53]KZT05999.1 hypothetical protein LAESUDRAFT_759881 [Laetiporus sulphureus 93-53]
MASTARSGVSAKFYQEDIVKRKDDPTLYGVVLRCWHDAEDIPPAAETVDPLMRPLLQGEVGVSYFPRPTREILLESELDLVDRMFQPGDPLKRSVDDVVSGMVTGLDVKGRLEHAISGEPIPGWKSTDEVDPAVEVDLGDYVVYDDWVGQVVEMFDEAIVDVGNGHLVRVPELSARLVVGEKGSDILPQPMSGVQSIFGFFLGNPRPSSQDTVVSVKRTVLAIAWLAINQSLDPVEATTRLRPSRFWHGPDLAKLILVRRRAEEALRVGDRVMLKNPVGVPHTHHGKEDNLHPVLDVYTCFVRETQTMVNVLWQDGTRETLKATEAIPYLNPDEYDCWPGDHVIWKTEDQKRAAIVQSVNAVERTALIRCMDTQSIELASLLELDPHGTADWSSVSPTAGLGVHRGDLVFIHNEGTTNGAEYPMVPRIGEVEEWVRELPMVNPNGQLGGWRRDMADIGARIAERRGKDPSIEEGHIQRPKKDDHRLNWFGEIIDLRLDGNVEVFLPDSTTTVLPLSRLTKLYDGLEQIEDLWGDVSEGEEGSEMNGEKEVEEWAMDESGNWVESTGEDAEEWESAEENEMEVEEDRWSSSSPTVHPLHHAEPSALVDSAIEIAENSTPQPLSPPSAARPLSPDVPQDAIEEVEMDGTEASENETPWKRFEILPSAPADHAFYSSSPAHTSRNFLARLNREYKALQSSLPDSILVRAYENRTDLLRSLIIGPENTPYQDAPFVIDWQLDSNFPQSPPIAHFLSWTNGNGRVNPNLYEEGKVCLSILGTWAGDKNETWNASRSSLLQAFVSIQGLVLVKEPWFCEPAYEKLRGTEEGILNHVFSSHSRLYSEKAYVLSRGFVRRALEIALGGLEAEMRWFYYTNGKLAKVLNDARALIEKSKSSKDSGNSAEDRELAVPRLTEGGIIALERTLAKLQAFLDAYDHQCKQS